MRFTKNPSKLYSKLVEKEVEGELQYFRERRVYPPFDKEGNIIWKQFLIGNWKTFGIVVLIVLVTVGIIFEYISNLQLGAACIAREQLVKNISLNLP